MIPTFTRRENDVLRAIFASAAETGHTSQRAVADALVVSERTIQTHLDRMFKKAGVSDKTSLCLWAVRQGVVI